MYDEIAGRLRKYAEAHCPLNKESDICGGVYAREAAGVIEKLIEVIQNRNFLESLIKPCWIPVTDHTPKYSGYYLVCDNEDNVYTAYFGNTTKNWWTEKIITHWMPRPDPPKEEKEDADS